jgi:hypothetical protein
MRKPTHCITYPSWICVGLNPDLRNKKPASVTGRSITDIIALLSNFCGSLRLLQTDPCENRVAIWQMSQQILFFLSNSRFHSFVSASLMNSAARFMKWPRWHSQHSHACCNRPKFRPDSFFFLFGVTWLKMILFISVWSHVSCYASTFNFGEY